MSNTEAINQIKTILSSNISQRESLYQANEFALNLGLSHNVALKMVEEISNEESWYGNLTDLKK